jgi:hypothetical protein
LRISERNLKYKKKTNTQSFGFMMEGNLLTTMKAIFHAAEKFVTDNTPGILTGLGVAGTVTTAVLTGKAMFNVGMDLNASDYLVGAKYDKKQLVKTYWKDFVPAAVSGVATVTCVIAANHIGTRRTAAIAAAFKLSEQLSEEYKAKVVQTLGLQKEEKVRSELAAERMASNPPSGMIVVAGSNVLFYDELSGRYFTNEMETVRRAVNEINHKVNNYYHASLSEFYDMIGLTATKFSDEFGWNSDQLLEVQFAATIVEGKPAIQLSYNHTPIRGFDRCQ